MRSTSENIDTASTAICRVVVGPTSPLPGQIAQAWKACSIDLFPKLVKYMGTRSTVYTGYLHGSFGYGASQSGGPAMFSARRPYVASHTQVFPVHILLFGCSLRVGGFSAQRILLAEGDECKIC